MSLEQYAEEEMRRAGLYDSDSDYGGMIPEAVMAMVRAHSAGGHSGGSHALTMSIFNRVVNFRPLTPLTSSPDEWGEVQPGVWQSRRCPSVFSHDGGKTYYDLDERQNKLALRLSHWLGRRQIFGRIHGYPVHKAAPA